MVDDDDMSLESESLEGEEEMGEEKESGSEVPSTMLRIRPKVIRSWPKRKCLVVRRG